MDLQHIIDDIAAEITDQAVKIEQGADAKDEGVQPGPFGIAVATENAVFHAGASATTFPIQSISKVLALEVAMRGVGDAVFKRVGREPSGDPFNSIIDLERTRGIPRNPFINAGALVVVDLVIAGQEHENAVIDFVQAQLSGGTVELDDTVLAQGGDLNRAMLSFMKHHGNVVSPIDRIMDAYGKQCAISIDCVGLALAGRFLTRTRIDLKHDHHVERAQRMRTILALMMTCGHYDASGDFAVRVGLPAKSGVGGGILAIAPERASVAVWSPNLDQHGNSMLGVRALEMLAARTGWSVFGPAAT